MALSRYRPVQFVSHYGVIEHAVDENGNYFQDGDPEDPNTITKVVFRTQGLSPEEAIENLEKVEELRKADV